MDRTSYRFRRPQGKRTPTYNRDSFQKLKWLSARLFSRHTRPFLYVLSRNGYEIQLPRLGSGDQSIEDALQPFWRPYGDPCLALLEFQRPQADFNDQDEIPGLILPLRRTNSAVAIHKRLRAVWRLLPMLLARMQERSAARRFCSSNRSMGLCRRDRTGLRAECFGTAMKARVLRWTIDNSL